MVTLGFFFFLKYFQQNNNNKNMKIKLKESRQKEETVLRNKDG